MDIFILLKPISETRLAVVLETNTSDTTLVTAHDLDKNTNQTIKPTIITTTGMMNKKRTKDLGVMPPYTNDINVCTELFNIKVSLFIVNK